MEPEVAGQMATLLKQMQVRPVCACVCVCASCERPEQEGGAGRAWDGMGRDGTSAAEMPPTACNGHPPPPPPPTHTQAALPAEVFQGFVAGLKPKQQARLQEVLSK